MLYSAAMIPYCVSNGKSPRAKLNTNLTVISRQNSRNTLYNAYANSTYEAYGKRDGEYDNFGTTPAYHQDPAQFGGQYGYYTDTETGLLCLTHRYYDPGTGKFINRDPIGYGGGANLYGFADGNPVNEMDPDGTSVLDKAEEYVVHHETDAVRRVGGFRGFMRSIRPSFFWSTAALSATLFFASTKTVADDSTGPGSPYYNQHREARTSILVSGAGSEVRRVRFRRSSNPNWGLTMTHLNKHLYGSGIASLKTIDPNGNSDIWTTHIADLLQSPVTSTTSNGMLDIIKEFPKSGGVPGNYKLGVRLAPQGNGNYDLITILTKQ